jgi:hypothetical protein
VTLVILSCLMLRSNVCFAHYVPLPEDCTPAVQVIQAWKGKHPNHWFRGARCENLLGAPVASFESAWAVSQR